MESGKQRIFPPMIIFLHSAYLACQRRLSDGNQFFQGADSYAMETVFPVILRQSITAIAVGRVMTCVLGMVVRREREIRSFVKTPFYRVLSTIELEGEKFEGEWRAVEGSRYFQSPYLYKENGFKEKKHAEELICTLKNTEPLTCVIEKIENARRKTKIAPLLFNLAELQNVCSKLFKISPDETLRITQELYEKKLVTYPRTDARVLSTAVSKEIYKNISGLQEL